MKKILKLIAALTVIAYLLCSFGGSYFGVFAETEIFSGEDIIREGDFAPAPEETQTSPVTNTPMYYLPHNLRGVIISPETDFLLSPEDDIFAVAKQLDDIFEHISDIGLNSVIIKTSVEDRLYYDLDLNKNGKTDFIKLAVERAQSNYLGVYLTFDIGYAVNFDEDSSAAINRLVSEVHKLTIKYPCDGIILDNYYNDSSVNNFTKYMREGTGIGYENWLYDSTEYLFETAGGVVRLTNNTIPVGVMINDVWADAYSDYFADTKKYIENKYADFILLRCYGSLTSETVPFTENANWWGKICDSVNIPMYLIHYNENIGNGWAEDQLLRQLKASKEDVTAYNGSVFNSYAALQNNLLNSAGTLKKYYADLIDEESLDKDLEIHSPKNSSFTTYEPFVNFMGTFDSNFDVKFNGKPIELNAAGNFWFEEPLQINMNVFTIEHKGKVQTYRIDRKIIVMKELDTSISEGKALRVDGGTTITLRAVAYKGAEVTATLNGKTVKLTEQTGNVLDDDPNSSYTSFIGGYKVPDGIIGTEQGLGQVSIHGTYMGQSLTLLGANVTVNAKPQPPKQAPSGIMFDERTLGSGDVVGTIGAVRTKDEQVTLVKLNSNYTNVFDGKTTGLVFNPNIGQLPASTVDYYRSTVGGFYTTESGKRFLIEDATLADSTGIDENKLFVREQGTRGRDSFFEIELDTRISYNVEVAGLSYFTDWGNSYNIRSFDAEYVYITFDNVTSVTKLPDFDSNYVFSSGKWEQVTIDGIIKFRLILQLRQKGVYAGNGAYYNSNGNLMLTFPVMTGSVEGMTIVIDTGHGLNSAGKLDPGAIGHIREFDANLAVAKEVEKELSALGANVIRLKTEENYIETKKRPAYARANYGCDMFIAIHSNSFPGNKDVRGTEVFYYTPFSQPLAREISNNIAGYFTNNVYSDNADKNRGAKNSYFWVTVEQSFPSVLVELGFVSNYEDAMALADETHQKGIAKAIIKGVQNYAARSSAGHVTSGASSVTSNPGSFMPEDEAPARDPEEEDDDEAFDDDYEPYDPYGDNNEEDYYDDYYDPY